MHSTLTYTGYGLIILVFLLPGDLFGQLSEGGTPYSFTSAFHERIARQKTKTTALPPINLRELRLKDEKSGGTARFAAPSNVRYNLANSGDWVELPNGDRLWQLTLEAQGALGLIVLYDDFYLPPGAKFFAYSPDRTQVLGAYTNNSNPANGKFLTGMIDGPVTVLEYYEPARVTGQGRINIFRVDQAYQSDSSERIDYEFKLHNAPMMRGFGTSLGCHVNVNCTRGNDWQDEKRGIVRIMLVVEEGTGWCSGSLLNNTRNDATPYVLSAFHCDDGFTPMHDFWRFDFNFESSDCTNPAGEPEYQSLLGCQLRAGRRESDFQLLEINSAIPSSYNAYYNGWNRSGSFQPARGTMIHHPSGDIKKISADDNPINVWNESITWLETQVITPAGHHFRAVLDEGTFEVGSSGSPLFDQNGRIVGQLNGGNASCSQFVAYFGRFALSWDAGANANQRLRDWLDPDNTGAETLDGMQANASGSSVVLTGVVKTVSGKAIPGATVHYRGEATGSIQTDAGGRYSVTLPAGLYTLSLSKDAQAGAGLSVGDITLLRQHILGKTTITSPYAIVASDINKNGGLSVADVVQLEQMILGKIDHFPTNSAWRFVESKTTLSANPLIGILPESVNVALLSSATYDFTGIKIGDVNESINPN